MIDHEVPVGKILVIPTGGYRFVGPCHVKLSGAGVRLPAFYADGTEVHSIGQEPSAIDELLRLGNLVAEPPLSSVPLLPPYIPPSPIQRTSGEKVEIEEPDGK